MGASMTTEQHNLAKQWFQSIDADGNGVISLSELKQVMNIPEKQLKHLILTVDTDNNKRLSYDEFLELWVHRFGPLFNDIDQDKTGHISKEEFVTFCVTSGATEQEASTQLKNIDTNTDGDLSFFEFARGLISMGIL